MSLLDIVNSPDDPLNRIAAIVDQVAEEECERHYDSPTQEHQLSAGLATAIERKLQEMESPPAGLKVAVQVFPEKGPGAWERPTGSDLYISLVRDDGEGEPFSKGMLVQSKWDRTFDPTDEKLQEQCRRMLARSPDSSYVWIFGEDRVYSAKAKDIVAYPNLLLLYTVGRQIAEGLKCNEGDPAIGRDATLPLPRGLTDVMRELAVENAIEFKLSQPVLKPRRRRRRRGK